jgi:leucyl-tRNA synthetase
MTYGSGAIMAVPAHDQRDGEFATQFSLEIRTVVEPENKDDHDGEGWFTGEGRNVNSSNDEVSLDGLPTAQAKQTIIDWLERTHRGKRSVQYRLRDWLFSRQRYWGEPFPIVYDEQGNHYPVDEANLPVTLPDMEDFQPVESDEPMPLLAKAKDWVHTTAGEAGVSSDVLPPDTPVRRETNTMPGWAGSCWYYLRFCDPWNDARFVSEHAEQYWMQGPQQSDFNRSGEKEPAQGGVDLYIGGAEHAVLHLLYARFWHKILYDLGDVSTPEPFSKLFHQGLLTSWAYQRADKSLVPIDEVDERNDQFIERATGEPVTQIEAKMSKSLRNVINPDDVISEFSADTFRLYEMYMGPLESSKPWNTRDTIGLFRFLQRLWRLVINEDTGALTLREQSDDEIERHLHRTIAKVGDDIEKLSLNTAIAAMIEFINSATSSGGLTADQLERFVVLLSPFAPHIAEELWSRLGHESTVADAPWPAHDQSMLQADTIEMPVQIMGKVRGRVEVPADADEKAVETIVLNDENIAAQLKDRTVRKVIVVPGKIVNIVAN